MRLKYILSESSNNNKRDTMSPILQCNISKSGSFSSDTRDFFDDEIADQPALMFSGPPSESCNVEDIDEAIFRLGNNSSSNKKCNNIYEFIILIKLFYNEIINISLVLKFLNYL